MQDALKLSCANLRFLFVFFILGINRPKKEEEGIHEESRGLLIKVEDDKAKNLNT